MIAKYKHAIGTILLVSLAVALLVYGLVFHSIDILPEKKGDSKTFAKSELALIKDTTVGGVMREKSGSIRQTYTGNAPSACPT